jgi:hypothetical protein
MIETLQGHPSVNNLHVQIVWKKFLGEPRIDSLHVAGLLVAGKLPEQLRAQLRAQAIQYVQMILPTATVSGRVFESG